MPTVYFADTGPELASLYDIVQKQAHDFDMALVRTNLADSMPAAAAAEIVGKALATADAFIAILSARRYVGVAGPASPSLAEIEITAAAEKGMPAAVFAPRPDSEIEASFLRRWAFAQDDAERAAYEAFLKRVEQQVNIVYYNDEVDLSGKIALALRRWRFDLPPESPSREVRKYTASEAEAAPPAPAPAAPAPDRSRERAAEAEPPLPAAAPLPFDVDALAAAIATRTAANLRALQLEDQAEVARRAVEYAEALRMRPGDLLFGRPSDASQFKSDAFMIMPFNPAFDGVYRSVVQPLFTELGLTVKRGDEFTSARGSIISEVWAALNACRFVIADITGGNDNVFYELGIAHTLNKPTLLITQADTPEQVPFDLRHLRYIAYDNTLAGADRLRADLRRAVEWLLNELRETWEARPNASGDS